MLKDALSFWTAIEGKVRDTVKAMSGKNLQCERYEVSTAPNSGTGLVGVRQPFGEEIFVPFTVEVAGASVGDAVLVAWRKSLSTAKAWSMADGPGVNSAAQARVNIGLGKTGTMEYDEPQSATSLASGTAAQVAEVTLSPGVWQVSGGIRFASNANGYRRGYFQVGSNGVRAADNLTINPINGADTFINFGNVVSVSVSTSVKLFALQTSGSGLNAYGRLYAVCIK